MTVGTLFHCTRVPLNKWFKAIALNLQPDGEISIRELARLIDVNKNTAASMIARIQISKREDEALLRSINNFWTRSK